MPSDAHMASVESAISQTFAKGATPVKPTKPAAAPKPKAVAAPAHEPEAAAADAPPDDLPELDATEPAEPTDADTSEPDGEPKHRQLLKAGKVNAALREAFGENASLDWLKVDDSKFAALRRRETEFDGRVQFARQDLGRKLGEVQAAEEALRKEWGPTKTIEEAAKKGDVVGTIEATAKRMGVAPDELVRAYVKGLKELPREARDRLARVEEQVRAAPQPRQAVPEQQQGVSPQQVQEATRKAVSELSDHLSGHAVAKLSNYGSRVFQEIKAQYAKDKTKLTPEKAADRVIARRKQELEADKWLIEGGERSPPKTPAATPPKRRLRSGAQTESTLSGSALRDAAIAKLFPGRSQ